MNIKNKDIVFFEFDYGLFYFKPLNGNFDTDEFGFINLESLCLTEFTKDKIRKLEILYGNIMDLSEPDPKQMIGYKSIKDVKYYLYYKLYVATLLSNEYKEGRVLLYGNNEEPITIEEYIKYLSTLTDEDLNFWLRPDLQ